MRHKRMTVLLLLVALATLGVYVLAFRLSTTRDRVDQIDTDTMLDVATAACVDLRTDVDALPRLPAGATAEQREARVGEQEALVARFVGQVEAAGPAALDADEPTREWLADWQALNDVRRDYVRGGLTGAFAVPVEDGRPITARMDAIGVEACVVPLSLTTSP